MLTQRVWEHRRALEPRGRGRLRGAPTESPSSRGCPSWRRCCARCSIARVPPPPPPPAPPLRREPAVTTVDARGLSCPMPLVMAKVEMEGLDRRPGGGRDGHGPRGGTGPGRVGGRRGSRLRGARDRGLVRASCCARGRAAGCGQSAVTTTPPRRGSPGARQRSALGVARHRLHAAEVEVALLQRRTVQPPASRAPSASGHARLRVQQVVLQVQSRGVHRRLCAEPAVEDAQRSSGRSPTGSGSSRRSPAPPRAARRPGRPSEPSCSARGAPGCWRWKPCGLRSSSPSMLFRWSPVPGTSTPEHDPLEQVTVAQRALDVHDGQMRR